MSDVARIGSRPITVTWPRVGYVVRTIGVGVGLVLLAIGQYLLGEHLHPLFENESRLAFLADPWRQRLGPGVATMVIGALLASVSLWVAPAALAVTDDSTPQRPSRWRLAGAIVAIVLAVAATAGIVFQLVTMPPDLNLATMLTLATYRHYAFGSALLLGGIGCGLVGRNTPGARLPFSVADALWIVACMGFFLWATVPTLTDPRWIVLGDEYAFFRVAYDAATGVLGSIFAQNGVYGDHPWFSTIIQALSMRVFGYDHFGWKMSGVVMGVLTIPPAYLTGRWLFGPAAGRIAGIVVATSHYLYAYAHSGYNNIDSVFPVILTICLAVAALQRPSPLLWYCAGAAAGFSLYFFFGARVAGPTIAVALLCRGWRPFVRGLPWALFGTFTVIAPFVAANGVAIITGMLGQGITARQGPASAFDVVHISLWSHVAFHYIGAQGHYLSTSLLVPIVAPLALLGLVLALTRLNDWRMRFLVMTYGFVLLVSGGLNLHPHPSETRLLPAVPILAVFIGLSVATIGQVGRRALSPRVAMAGSIIAVALIGVGTAATNLHVFREVSPSRNWSPPEAVMIKAMFSPECRGAGHVPIGLWHPREGLIVLALASFEPTRYLPFLINDREYQMSPAYREWPCTVVSGSNPEYANRIINEAIARDPQVRAIRFTDGPGSRWAVALIRPRPSDPFAAATLPAVGSHLYAVHRTNPLRGHAPGAFTEPGDVAVTPDGRRFVPDVALSRISEFSRDGQFIAQWRAPGVLVEPGALAIDERGLIVIDRARGQIVEFDAERRVTATHSWAALGLKLPKGLAIDSDGRIAVADEAESTIVLFDRSFAPLARFADSPGDRSAGPAFRPSDVRFGPDGSVYAYDGSTGRFRRYARDGGVIGTWALGPREGRIAVAPDGSLWLAVAGATQLIRYDANGNPLARFGPPTILGDTGDGISSVAVDDRGLVTIAWRGRSLTTYRIAD